MSQKNRKQRRAGPKDLPPLPLLEQAMVAAYKAEKYEQAFNICCDCILRAPDNNLYKLRLSQFTQEIKCSSFTPDLKRVLLACLNSHTLDHQKFSGLWTAFLQKDPLHQALINISQDSVPDSTLWRSLQGSFQDDFLLEGLKKLALPNQKIENVFKNLRRLFLGWHKKGNILKTKHLPALSALGTHCFFNEYVFDETEEEKEAAEYLQKAERTPLNLALLRCYRTPDEAPPPLSIPSIGPIKNKTSEKVRAMYEENPYPRWQSIDLPPYPQKGIEGNWLIAGCGTGRPALQAALMFPDIHFTAIDLSLASLAYAKQKACKYGANNLEFIHCDILNLDKLEKTFDIIECSGVLHHMQNPEEGWKRLIRQMSPGGRMNIGLYSLAARESVQAARKYAAEKDYPATTEGIRAFRQDIFALPDTHPAKAVSARRDFYTLSECRDLVFHVQEKNYTLPELAETFKKLDLTFLGFTSGRPQTTRLYRKTYPEDPQMANLSNWQALESEHPDLFIGMYQFLCCRASETTPPCLPFEKIEKSLFFK